MKGDPLLEAIPSTSKLARAPEAVLLGYQQRWVADPAPFKVAEKGRRTGLTWAEASDDVLIAASDKAAGGQNVYYVGTDKEMTEEYIDACAMWARAFNYAATEIGEGVWDEGDDDEVIKTFTIRFPKSGHKIIALASRPRKLRGRQGVLVGDEAAFQDQLDELIKAAMAFLIWGGKVRLISTHDGAESPFNELLKDIRAGKRKGSIHRITFQDAVADGLYRRVCLRLGKPWSAAEEAEWVQGIYEYYGDGSDEELDCIPSNSAGKYLPVALLEQRQNPAVPVLRLTLSDEFVVMPKSVREAEVDDWLREHVLPLLATLDERLTSYYGLDFARSGDLSVFWPLLQSQDLVCRTPFLLEMRNVPFAQQKQVIFWILNRLPNFSSGANDARGNGQQLAEETMQEFGADRIHMVMLTEGWYRENMPHFKASLTDGTFSDLPRDKDVMNDLRAFEVVRGVARVPDRRAKGSDGKDRHGDAGIAAALADFAAAHDVYQPAAYHSATVAALQRDARDGMADWDDQVRTTAGFGTRTGVW
jgi:phage FluMu gp28-like protein